MQRLNILFLPKWYPTRADRQFGVFVHKHAKAVSHYCNVAVVNIIAGPSDKIDIKEEKGRYEIEVQYKKSRIPLLSLYRYMKAGKNGVQLALKKFNTIHLAHVHVLNRPALIARWLKKTYG